MNQTIEIYKKDEVYLQLDVDVEQCAEINSFFAYYVKNYMYAPRYKSRQWNGKAYLFDVKNRTLPIGLAQDLITFCKQFNYNYNININKNDILNNITDEEFLSFYKEIFKDSKFYPRDYQAEAIKQSLTKKRGIIEIGTGGGKSIILYCIIRYLLNTNKKILLIVPNISLVQQMFTDFKEYNETFDIEKYTSRLYADKSNYDEEKPILISTWQSLYKKPQSFFEKFNGVICDEVHLAAGLSIKTILSRCINAEYRIGCSGTIPEDMCLKQTIFGYIGQLIHQTKSKELIDEGVLSDIKIVNLFLKYPYEIVNANKYKKYEVETDNIINYQNRNIAFKYIIENVNKSDNILVLVKEIEHLKQIEKYIKENFPDRLVCEIYGETKVDDRENIRKSINNNSGIILVASYGTVSTGVNIVELNHIILGTSYRSKIKILQAIGRGLRKSETKKKMIAWDLVDDLRWTTKTGNIWKNHSFNQWEERLQNYKDQKFDYVNRELKI